MGFFDKITKGLASEVLGNIVQGVTDYKNQTAERSTAQNPTNVRYGNPVNHVDIKTYFSEILTSEFSQYQVRANVPLSEFDAERRPFDFGLYQNGELVAVVVLAEHNKTRNHPYWNLQKKAVELKIPFINFYTHMENERSYVIDRIHRLMK